MKPLLLCSECRTELQWGERFCSSCGRPAEWPSQREPERQSVSKPKSEKARPQTPPALSWKMMAGFAVFLVGGVIVLELLTGTGTVPVQPAQTAQQQGGIGANMEAVKHLKELEAQVSANPNDAVQRLHLANFAHDNRFYDKAIEHYRKYLEGNPRDPDVLVDLGICYNDIGNFTEARSFMMEALEVSPKHLLAHFNLGIVNLKAGDVEKSNEWFKKTTALSPDSEVGKRAKALLEQHGTIANPDGL
ncbi:MAG: tetratricopeptide repeat protein [Bacteroidota bacterium]